MSHIHYIERINQAIDYIHKNLHKNLTVEEIADHCCFSRFYFNRMFKAVINESVYSFIKRRKLENAAFLLRAKRDLTITDIALRVGYSPSNFASAFKEHYGISASEYRKTNDIPLKEPYLEVAEYIQNLKKRKDSFDFVNAKVNIRKIGPLNLFYERFIGHYSDLSDFWGAFCEKVIEKQMVGQDISFIGISYDDPLITNENRCIYDVCINIKNTRGANVHIIKEGYYACYEFHDQLTNLAKAYNELFSLWLSYCGYDLDNRFPLEIYKSDLDEQGRMKVDICLPIIKD